jgi:uncharacterized protein (DUF2141 family)
MANFWRNIIVLISVLLGISALAAADSGRLTVELTNMKSDEGRLVYAMWSGPEGWLESNTVREGTSPVSAGRSTLAFDDLPYGEYAISVYHDRNDNGKLDTGLFRMPKEPLGTSNDAKIRFGPPKYEDAVFILDQPELRIQIPVKKLFE